MRFPCQSRGMLFSSNKNLLFTSLKSQSSLINFLTCNYFMFRGRCYSPLTPMTSGFVIYVLCILGFPLLEYLYIWGEIAQGRAPGLNMKSNL